MVITLTTVGRKIASLRALHKHRQQDLASLIFVARQKVADWELDRYLPRAEDVERLAVLYDVPASYFLPTAAVDLGINNTEKA